MKQFILLVLLFFFVNIIVAQYPPAAGQEGSTAIHFEDSRFINWAKTCEIERGFLDVAQPELGLAGTGFEEAGLGVSDNNIASLGDGGVAVLTFDPPIRDGIGWDFAVFENGFSQGENADFLELAFVEVSSDGENYVQFPAISLIQDTIENGGFSTIDARTIHNFAGKYVAGYGTPFDLAELEDFPNLDRQNITHIRLIDVVGTINDNYASIDSEGKKVNDPYPTAFPSGGFDLDAVGVIKEVGATTIKEVASEDEICVFPNPVKSGQEIFFDFKNNSIIYKVVLKNLSGEKLCIFERAGGKLPDLSKGIYFFTFYGKQSIETQKVIIF